MTVAIFSDCVFFLKLNDLSFKERKALKFTITSNGGVISFVLNQKCTHVVVNTVGCLSASQQKNVQKHRIQIVDSHFIGKCLEEKCLIHDYQYPTAGVQPSKTKSQSRQADPEKAPALQNKDELMDSDHSEYDAENFIDPPDTEVAKYCFFHKGFNVAFLELLCFPESSSFLFKISKVICNSNGTEPDKSFHFANTAEAACNKYEKCSEDLKKQGFKSGERIPAKVALQTSEALQKVLLEEAINATKLSPDVGYFVETVWTEALGHLDNILSCPVNSISLNDVSKAEGVLLQARKALDTGTEPRDIMNAMVEFYRLIPHKMPMLANVNKKFLSTKQDLCQVVRDMVSVCETNLSKPNPSSLAKYQALRCQIEHVDPDTEEFHQVSQQIMENKHCEDSVNILKIFRIGKLSEATGFQRNLGNVKSLLHASSPCHFVGILSRGLLLPKNVEDDLGLERTDIGNLGSGVYFSDSISTSVKYSEPSVTNGARHLLVCDVALGNCKDLYKRDFSLTEAPSGFDSVHGVRQMPGRKSDFEDDEFVVYSKDQVKMRYVVQFCTAKDQVNMEHDKLPVRVEPMEEDVGEESVQAEDPALESLPEPQSIKGGLQSVHGNQIPLENIHVKGRIMDLVAEVILFQTYINQSSVPIEAKYVFPLDSTAAVCGFEAFINGKHVIGEVKEKKQAHQEYRAAIREGHGAYLMDQDAADIFTVSVGNLPPNATVIIKITYITELNMNYRTVDFKLPGTVASWQKDKALKENTQDTVEKICVEESGVPKGCFSLEMSVEMCFKITSMMSYTHEILMKKTDCKAVIATKKDSSLNEEGFELAVALESNFADSSWNQPRMWVEKHPDEESEACMLVFLPSFETYIQSWDLTILLDCSNSMESTFQSAKRIALLAAGLLNTWHNVNIINFGTSYKEFSIRPKENNSNALTEVEQFIKLAKPNMGNTELWKPLQSLCLLAPSGGTMHNVLLISDGHVQNESRVFQILKKNAGKVRLFTCGVGSTANRHMLRCLAQYGAGFFEFFEDKSKSSWKKKMEAQLEKMDSPACTSASVKWMQFSENDPEPVQAPAHIPALFNHSCLLVYGFAPRCTQAKLQALIDDKELDTVVSTTELQKTRGTMLHKLTARAIIKDYEDGILHEKEQEHEMKKQQTKSFIIELSKKYSIVTQFTSFVAVEKRDAQEKPKDYVPNVLEIISAEVVDILPYMTWETQKEEEKAVMVDRLKFLDCDSSANDIHRSFSNLLAKKKKVKRNPLEADGTPDCFSDCIEEQAEMKLMQADLRIADEGEIMTPTSSSVLYSGLWDMMSQTRSHETPTSSSVFDRPSRLEHQLQQSRLAGAPRIMQMRQCVISSVTKASPSSDVSKTATFGSGTAGFKGFGIRTIDQSSAVSEVVRSSDVLKTATFGSGTVGFKISSVSEASPTFSFGTAGLASSAVSEAVRTFSSGTAGFKSSGFLSSASGFGVNTAAQSSGLMGSAPSYGFLGSTSAFGVNTAAQSSGLMGSAPSSGFLGSASGFGVNTAAQSSGVIGSAPSSGFLGSASGFGVNTAAQSSGRIGSAPGFSFAIPPQPPLAAAQAPISKSYSPLQRHLSFSFAIPPQPPLAAAQAPISKSYSPLQRHLSFSFAIPPQPPLAAAQASISQSYVRIPKTLLRRSAFRMPLMALQQQIASPSIPVQASMPSKRARTRPSFSSLSALQCEEGYWLLNEELGSLLNINVNYLIDEFLSKNGIQSLGRKGKEDVLKLIATLLVLQVICTFKLVNVTFKSLMKLDESCCTSPYYQTIEKSTKWARKTDEQYPGICSRLGLGKDWESATRKLLSIDPLDPSSSLLPAVV